jgi:6-pyruvoyltetrahydropterin/6-carboxytetrahydropterin synthase
MGTVQYHDPRHMRLEVEFHFAAAHRLPRHPGACRNLHGHNYRFFVALEGEVDPGSGMIFDFDDLKKAVREHVLGRVDHRDLNEVLDNPTAENLVRWIWEALEPSLPGLCEVRLHEIPDSCVTYRGQGGRR